MTIALAIPRPAEVADVHGLCADIEREMVLIDDVSMLHDAKAKLTAIDAYVAQTSKVGREALAATMRRLEVRIGEVLGRATVGAHSSAAEGTELTRHERSEFREMAENKDVVEGVIAASSDEQPASRRAVLHAIKNAQTPRRSPLGDDASSAAWRLRKSMEAVERVFADDRFKANKEQVANHVAGHLSYVVEVCQGLIDRLNREN